MDSSSFNKAPASSYVSADNPWHSVESVPFNNGGGAPMSEGSEQSKMQKEISQLILNDDGTRKTEYIDESANGEREKDVEKDIDKWNEELNKKVERGEISKEEAYRRQDERLEDAIKRIDEIRMEEYERQRQEQAEDPLLKESKDQKSPQELMDEIDANRNRELRNKKAFQVAVTPGITTKGNSVAKDEFERVIGEKVTKETATGRIIGEKHYAELADTDYNDDYQVETWVIKDIADLKPEPTTEELRHDFEQDQDLRNVINEEIEDAISESESKPTSPKNPETEKNPEDIEESLVRLGNKLHEYHKDGKISKNQIDRLIDNLDKFVEKKAKTAAEQDKPSVEQTNDQESKQEKIAEAEKREQRLNELRKKDLELKQELNQNRSEQEVLMAASGEIKDGKRPKFSFLNWLSNLRQNRKQKAKTEEPNPQGPEATIDTPPTQEDVKEPEAEGTNPLETADSFNKSQANFWRSVGQEGLELMKANYDLETDDEVAKVESVWNNLDDNAKDMIISRYKYRIGSTLRNYLIGKGLLPKDNGDYLQDGGPMTEKLRARLIDKNKYLDNQYYLWTGANRSDSAA